MVKPTQRVAPAACRRCVDDVPFRWLACGAAPDYRPIARFRKRHLSALAQLFLQALKLCQSDGMVSLVRVGRHEGAGERLQAQGDELRPADRQEKVLAEEASALLAEAQRIDDAEDAQFGKDRRDDELPAELARRESRLAKLREAEQALEDQAREAAAEHAAELARRKGADEDTSPSGPRRPPRRRSRSPRRNGTSPTRTARS